MHKQLFSSTLVLLLGIVTGISTTGCQSGFRDIPACGCTEEPCDLSSCDCAEEPCNLPSCGCAEEPCNSPSCGIPACGCTEGSCDTVGCGNGIECDKCHGGWLKKLFGYFQLRGCAGCDGELYWSEWHNDPPSCEPCDSCGNWVGPRGVYRAPYRTLPDGVVESLETQEDEPFTALQIPGEDSAGESGQDDLREGYSSEPDPAPNEYQPFENESSEYQSFENGPQDDPMVGEERLPMESFDLALERETLVR